MDVRLLCALAAVVAFASACDGEVNRYTYYTHADECTAEQMAGFHVIGYGAGYVFRFEYEEGYSINLLSKLVTATNGLVESDKRDFRDLLHLHQGFNSQLMLLDYGYFPIDERELGADPKFFKMENSTEYKDIYTSRLMDSSSIRLAKYRPTYQDQVWNNRKFPRNHTDVRTFTSFVYDSKIYFEGGHADASPRSTFVPHSQDICTEIEFPVADIAFYPPRCYNRNLGGAWSEKHNRTVDDEWIVAVVNDTWTTRSETLCKEHKNELTLDLGDFRLNFGKKNTEGQSKISIADDDLYCYYMKSPSMKKPCLFAYGNKYIFQDVQVLPTKPISPPAELPTTTTTPNPFCISKADLDFDKKFEVLEYIQDCIVRHTSLRSAIDNETPNFDDCSSLDHPVDDAKFFQLDDSALIMVSGIFNGWQSSCTVLEMPNLGDHVPVKQRNVTGFRPAGLTSWDLLQSDGTVLLFSHEKARGISRTVGYEIQHEDGNCWAVDAQKANYDVSAEPFASVIEGRIKFAQLGVDGVIEGFGWKSVAKGLDIYEHPNCPPFKFYPADESRILFLAPRFVKLTGECTEANTNEDQDKVNAGSLSSDWILCLVFSSITLFYDLFIM